LDDSILFEPFEEWPGERCVIAVAVVEVDG